MPKKKPPFRLHLSEWIEIRRQCEAARVAALAAVQAAPTVQVVQFTGYTFVAERDFGGGFEGGSSTIVRLSSTMDDMMSVIQALIDRGYDRIIVSGAVNGAPDARFLAHGLPTESKGFSLKVWCRATEQGEGE